MNILFSRVKVGLAIAILVGAVTQSAQADELVSIRGGTFTVDADGAELDIFGNKGFELYSGTSIHNGVFEGFSKCQDLECVPGTIIDLDAFFAGTGLGGRAKLRGVTYENVGGVDSDSSASIEFSSGPITIPALSDGPVSITVPFEASGVFAYGLTGPDPQQPALFAGGGQATLLLRLHPEGTAWIIQRVVFDFRPVEPR